MLEWSDWALLIFCSLLIGADKSGFRGLTIVAVPLFAGVFGGRVSTAVVLPLLLTGDFYAVWLYRRHLRFRQLLKLLPATLVGLVSGMVLGNRINDDAFQLILAIVLLICVVLMVLKELLRHDLVLPDRRVVHATGGYLGGLTTMMGNAAAPIMSIYLLSFNFTRDIFIGTGAVFFLTVNLLKLPIHLFVWKSLNTGTFLASLRLAPFVILGLILGYLLVKRNS